MARKYTVLFIDDKGNPVRETLVSKRSIWVFSAVVMLLFGFIAMGSYHYTLLQKAVADKEALHASLERQKAEIEGQRTQIKSFAYEINTLKASLVNLNEFEHKIRIMANLEHKGDQASLIGIGGSTPDDLDPKMALNQDNDRLLRTMHTHINQFQQASSIQQDNFATLLKSLEAKRNLLACTPSLRPTDGWVSSGFGYRISPFTGRKEFHNGLDLATKEGTPIIAPADGVITYAGPKWLMGNMITIDHGYGMVTQYGHIKKLLKDKGDRVKRGDVIALVGNTGRSTGPHVHYIVRLNGVPVNPEQYILD
jgi:murein DD-endopeptidase MepM/ murein hydrolase activator NlpD